MLIERLSLDYEKIKYKSGLMIDLNDIFFENPFLNIFFSRTDVIRWNKYITVTLKSFIENNLKRMLS